MVGKGLKLRMQMTKRVFKDTIKSLKNDPSFLAELTTVCLETMPKNLAEYVVKQAYIKYVWDDVYYEVHDLIHGTTEHFLTVPEIHSYLLEGYPHAKKNSIYVAISRGEKIYNHTIKKIEPTV